MPRPSPEPRRQPGLAVQRTADTANGRSDGDAEQETAEPRQVAPSSAPDPATASAPPAPDAAHTLMVKDLATLRVLADPLRLAILGAFGEGRREYPMTVKDIAERIDEGPTKLYRHVKQLEEAGLLAVAGTRLVSGILEKSYRPVYRRIDVDDNLLNLPGQENEYEDTLSALLEAGRMRFVNDLRSGAVVVEQPSEGPDLSMEVTSLGANLRPEQYAELRAKVSELITQMAETGEGQERNPETIPVRLQVLLYAVPSRGVGAHDTDTNADTDAADGSA